MSTHRLIRDGRLKLGMTEHQFAEAVGVSRSAVQQWEKPGGTSPKRANQPRVAQLLNVSIAELVSGESTKGTRQMRPEVPLISELQSGNYTVIDNFNPVQQFENVRVTIPVRRHTYALRVHGDSMVSELGDSFPDGSILIVEPEMEAQPGDYVIALNAQNQTTFKQLTIDGGEFYLRALNTRYPIKPLGTARVIGVVREFRKKFR